MASKAGSAIDPIALAVKGGGAVARKLGTKTPTKKFVAGCAERLNQLRPEEHRTSSIKRQMTPGVKFPQAEYGKFVKDATAKLRAEGVDSVLHPKANRIVGILEETAGEAPDLQRLQILRKQFGDAAASTDLGGGASWPRSE